MTGTARTTADGRPESNSTGDDRAGPHSTTSDPDPLHATLQSTGRFVWDHLPSIILVSVAWFFASLPVVTVGPATVGAYRAVLSLRAGNGLDSDTVLATVRRQFIHATLLGLLPLVVLLAAANYALAYLATGALLAGGFAAIGLYLGLYATLVLLPTFIGLAHGENISMALWNGYRWTARHAVATMVLGTMTVALLALASLMTVAVALLFAGVACAFHIEFITGIDDVYTPSVNP